MESRANLVADRVSARARFRCRDNNDLERSIHPASSNLRVRDVFGKENSNPFEPTARPGAADNDDLVTRMRGELEWLEQRGKLQFAIHFESTC